MKHATNSATKVRGESINAAVRRHVLRVSDWQYQGVVEALHAWFERFNDAFKLGLPTPAISVDRLPARTLGTYRQGRNGFGLLYEIRLNSRLLHRPLAEQLATLLHEMLHQWQDLYGRPGRPGYHNLECRRRAERYGLIVDERGHQRVVPGAFTTLLARFGVELSTLPLAEAKPILAKRWRGSSKLKKWSCGCTNVRCAVELRAMCLKCGFQFEEVPPAW